MGKIKKMVASPDSDQGTTVEYMEEMGKLPKLVSSTIRIDSIRDFAVGEGGKLKAKTLLFKMNEEQKTKPEKAHEDAGRYWVENQKLLKKMGFDGFAFEHKLPEHLASKKISLSESVDELRVRLEKAKNGELDDSEVDELLEDGTELVSSVADAASEAIDDDDDDEDDEDEDEEEALSTKSALTNKKIKDLAASFRRIFKRSHGAKAAKHYKLLKKSLDVHVRILAQVKSLSVRDLRLLAAGASMAASMDTKKNRALLLGSFLAICDDMMQAEEDDD